VLLVFQFEEGQACQQDMPRHPLSQRDRESVLARAQLSLQRVTRRGGRFPRRVPLQVHFLIGHVIHRNPHDAYCKEVKSLSTVNGSIFLK